jgi:hypothetical protein
MTLTAPATRKLRGYKAGFTIQPTTPSAPAAPTIGTIVVLDNYILTVPVSSVPADADYAELLWSDTENGTYTVYQSNIPALVTTNVSVNTVTAATKWFKARSVNAYGSTLSAATSATSSAGTTATPNQMVNLRVTSKTTTSLTYAWDALANVTSYTLQRWNGSDWTTAQITGITDTTYTVNTLTANTEYGARGRGVNTNAASPNGPLSAETWDFTEAITTPVPTPPTVTWTRISSTVIRFLMSGGSDATSWQGFSRSPSGSGSYSSPISLTVNQASYDLTVSINETADFYVTATNNQGSANSNTASGSAAGGAFPEPNLVFANFEGGTLSAPSGPAPSLNADSFAWGSSINTAVVTGGRSGGSYGLRFRYPVASTYSSNAEQRFSFGTPHSELWGRFWLRVPDNFTHALYNNKLIALWMDGYSSLGDGPTVVWEYWANGSSGSNLAIHWSEGNHLGGGPHLNFTSFISVPADRGRWMQIVFYVKKATVRIDDTNQNTYTPNDGIIRLWRRWDGDSAFTQIHNITNANIASPPGGPDGFKNGYLMGAGNTSWAAQTDFFIDEVEFSTSSLI